MSASETVATDQEDGFDARRRPVNAHSLKALEHHKAEGMRLAFRARLIALAVIIILLPIINPYVETIYYMVFVALFALNGWAQLKVATVGRSRMEVRLLAVDLILLTVIILVPNPFFDFDRPLEMQYQFGGHAYLYIYLALGTLAYSWRTIRVYAFFGAVIWGVGVLVVWLLSEDHPSSALFQAAMQPYADWAYFINPGNIRLDLRIQEIVLFTIVAFILSLTVKRFSDLMMAHAESERERTNLSRYFSPNMVDNLAHNDEPLKQIKTQNVAVLFVDIVGFTTYANERTPEEVIATLREFHRLMEKCVFDHSGTLDKFLGDGLMATFGTPEESPQDAANALKCAEAMLEAVQTWNRSRTTADEPDIQIALGLHFGPCVLGDIGGDNRLEFAVIGDTVNIASRVEAKTRELGVRVAMTETFASKVVEQSEDTAARLDDFTRFDNQTIRGVAETMTLLGASARNN